LDSLNLIKLIIYRTQKAEIEALQATIEKMKSTHDTAARKWKTTENRLYALIHEHSDHIENLEKQVCMSF
jgi:archaellum component FlaC